MPKRTYKPSRVKRAKTHGFRIRNASLQGKKVIRRRIRKERKRI